jgi:hypothetical protein
MCWHSSQPPASSLRTPAHRRRSATRFTPLGVLYRKRRREVAVNPTRDLDLARRRGKRNRYAEPAEAVRLLETLPGADRALWATAIYAGLDNGELQALQVGIDLEAGVIHVRQSWEKVEGILRTKTEARSGRQVPICGHLRQYVEPLVAGRGDARSGRQTGPTTTGRRLIVQHEGWADADLEKFNLHDGRRSFRNYLDAARRDAPSHARSSRERRSRALRRPETWPSARRDRRTGGTVAGTDRRALLEASTSALELLDRLDDRESVAALSVAGKGESRLAVS